MRAKTNNAKTATPNGRALLQSTTLRGTTQSTVAVHRGAGRAFREEAIRNEALTAEKRPVRKAQRLTTQ
jgi:hypothetical protein